MNLNFSHTVDVDRDSVAMGDDMRSHAHQVTALAGMRLSRLVKMSTPEIRERGWSWVVVADDRTIAVWSVDHGVQMLVPDSRLTGGGAPARLYFRYFVQIDPAWLHRRLGEGAAPNRQTLELEYQPIARTVWENEQRRRERESPERLISAECVSVLVSLGARLDLHNDRTIRFDLRGSQWTANRVDTMTMMHSGIDGLAASIRPAAFAECWLVAAAGSESRAARGHPRLPDFRPLPAPHLETMSSWPPGVPRWTTVGPLVAQLSGEDAVSCFRLAFGRSIAEIAELLERGVTTA